MLKNGHKFVQEGKDKDPREKWPAASGGDYGCVLCGAWTTYCLSSERADEKMGICPVGKNK